MDRKELLNKIATKELARMRALPIEDFLSEVYGWFGEGAEDGDTEDGLLVRYIEDYMSHQEDKDDAELLEILNR